MSTNYNMNQNMEFHKYPSVGNCDVSCRQTGDKTDEHDKAFCNCFAKSD